MVSIYNPFKRKTDFSRTSFTPTDKARRKLFGADDTGKRWAVLASVLSNHAATANDIAEELGVRQQDVEKVLAKLVDEGYIQAERRE